MLTDQPDKKTIEPVYPESLTEYSLNKRLQMEKEVLGVFVSGHPLDTYKPILKDLVTIESSKLRITSEMKTI